MWCAEEDKKAVGIVNGFVFGCENIVTTVQQCLEINVSGDSKKSSGVIPFR